MGHGKIRVYRSRTENGMGTGKEPGKKTETEQLMILEGTRGMLCFPGSSDGKASAYNAGDPGSIPGSGRSSGEGNGNPLQYSCLENSMDGGAW